MKCTKKEFHDYDTYMCRSSKNETKYALNIQYQKNALEQLRSLSVSSSFKGENIDLNKTNFNKLLSDLLKLPLGITNPQQIIERIAQKDITHYTQSLKFHQIIYRTSEVPSPFNNAISFVIFPQPIFANLKFHTSEENKQLTLERDLKQQKLLAEAAEREKRSQAFEKAAESFKHAKITISDTYYSNNNKISTSTITKNVLIHYKSGNFYIRQYDENFYRYTIETSYKARFEGKSSLGTDVIKKQGSQERTSISNVLFENNNLILSKEIRWANSSNNTMLERKISLKNMTPINPNDNTHPEIKHATNSIIHKTIICSDDKQKINVENRCYHSGSLIKYNWHNLNLKNLRFEFLNIKESSFKNLFCTNCEILFPKFESSDLKNTNFNGAPLIFASFKGADLRGANFDNCNLIGADFSEAILDNTSFSGANLSGAKFDKAQGETTVFLGATFTKATSFKNSKFNNPQINSTIISPSQMEYNHTEMANSLWYNRVLPICGKSNKINIYKNDKTLLEKDYINTCADVSLAKSSHKNIQNISYYKVIDDNGLWLKLKNHSLQQDRTTTKTPQHSKFWIKKSDASTPYSLISKNIEIPIGLFAPDIASLKKLSEAFTIDGENHICPQTSSRSFEVVPLPNKFKLTDSKIKENISISNDILKQCANNFDYKVVGYLELPDLQCNMRIIYATAKNGDEAYNQCLVEAQGITKYLYDAPHGNLNLTTNLTTTTIGNMQKTETSYEWSTINIYGKNGSWVAMKCISCEPLQYYWYEMSKEDLFIDILSFAGGPIYLTKAWDGKTYTQPSYDSISTEDLPQEARNFLEVYDSKKVENEYWIKVRIEEDSCGKKAPKEFIQSIKPFWIPVHGTKRELTFGTFPRGC